MSAAEVAQIRLVSIGKRYSGTKALDDVSVEVAEGSAVSYTHLTLPTN